MSVDFPRASPADATPHYVGIGGPVCPPHYVDWFLTTATRMYTIIVVCLCFIAYVESFVCSCAYTHNSLSRYHTHTQTHKRTQDGTHLHTNGGGTNNNRGDGDGNPPKCGCGRPHEMGKAGVHFRCSFSSANRIVRIVGGDSRNNQHAQRDSTTRMLHKRDNNNNKIRSESERQCANAFEFFALRYALMTVDDDGRFQSCARQCCLFLARFSILFVVKRWQL